MIRNSDGIWVNTQLFREEAVHFEKNGYYTEAPRGSYDYDDYWLEQYRRCREGYSVGGAKITGPHYFYLNFCQIQRTEDGKNKKVYGFPRFWNGDYNYFWVVDIARNGIDTSDYLGLDLDVGVRDLGGGLDVCVGKARRKGFSYKGTALATCAYSTQRSSNCLVGAFDSKYTKLAMRMVRTYLNFLDEHTEFGKRRDYLDTREHVKASFKQYVSGRPIEKGYRSEIQSLTFGNNPDAGRGDDRYLVLFDEAGKWPGMAKAYAATKPSTGEGAIRTGQIILYGTSSMDVDGDTHDFIDMYYNPEGYGLIPLDNVWDEDAGADSCSFFFPDYWGKEGFVDENGNDDTAGAREYEIKIREKKRSKLSASGLLSHVVEYPFSPEEAFLVSTNNDFPTLELQARLSKILEGEAYKKIGDVVELVFDENEEKVLAHRDLKGKLSPHWRFPSKTPDPRGAVVIYEHPIENPEFGYYKVAYDPYRQDQSTMDSRGAIIVYRGYDMLSTEGDKIVGIYVGRPETYDQADEICLRLAVYYNAEVMFENEVTHPKDYFKSRRKEKYLAFQPTAAINAVVKDSKVKRVYGMHMSDKIKDTAAKKLKKWLLETHTFVDGEPIRNLDRIPDPGLLEEIIKWNRKGNFDRVSAMFMLMFSIDEISASMRETERSNDSIANKLAERYRRIKHGAKTNAYAGF